MTKKKYKEPTEAEILLIELVTRANAPKKKMLCNGVGSMYGFSGSTTKCLGSQEVNSFIFQQCVQYLVEKGFIHDEAIDYFTDGENWLHDLGNYAEDRVEQ
jgi:hypothetical protein